MVKKTIRIGTRDSELALWQANTVQKKLNDLGHKTEIIAVKSQGDLMLDKYLHGNVERLRPLYELGITGIFTKTLDIAMINGQIDIAVHSMKDVPTAMPIGMMQAAVLKRANVLDILVCKNEIDFIENAHVTIATGSLRRQAMWLNKYPNHNVVDLRGNVQTRLQKLQDNNWQGAVFAAAGIERLNLKLEATQVLDWMIPAPAQGAMVIHAMQKDEFSKNAVADLNDLETDICTYIERQFLKTLEGGCTAPIGALATFIEADDIISFKGILLSLDGKQKIEVSTVVPIQEWKKLGFHLAQKILNSGGVALMATIKESLKK